MHPSDWSRLLTERQREVLTIVVENKVYRNRDSKIPELAAQMGIAPAAVAKHLLEIEKTALLNVVVSPSEQGKRVYERLELEPRPEQKQTAEVLDRNTVTILRFLHVRPDASVTEVAEELGFSEYTTVNSLRVLMAVQLITKQRGPAVRRGVPPYVYRPTAHGEDLAVRFPADFGLERFEPAAEIGDLGGVLLAQAHRVLLLGEPHHVLRLLEPRLEVAIFGGDLGLSI